MSVSENLGWALFIGRRFDDAIAQFRKTLDLEANFGQAWRYLGLTYLQRGETPDAIESLERARAALMDVPEITADLALAYRRAGRDGDAGALLKKLTTEGEYAYVSPYLLASYYTGVGESETALDWLEKAYDERSANLIFLAVDPLFDGLRDEPKFVALLDRVGIGDVRLPVPP